MRRGSALLLARTKLAGAPDTLRWDSRQIEHPSGTTVVDASVEHADDPAKARVIHGAVYRTARRLFEGNVFSRAAKGVGTEREVGIMERV